MKKVILMFALAFGAMLFIENRMEPVASGNHLNPGKGVIYEKEQQFSSIIPPRLPPIKPRISSDEQMV